MLSFASVMLSGRIIVFPFKVTPADAKAHQWLGRAVSFHIADGLSVNAIDVLPDYQVEQLLDTNRIRFPYSMSRATAIRLARELDAEKIIWGEVIFDTTSHSSTGSCPLKLNAFVMDLENYSRKHLPFLTSNLKMLYKVENEMLKYIIEAVAPERKEETLYPDINLNYHDYEIFIKSLLLNNNAGKLKLLERISAEGLRSDYVNFYLSRLYLDEEEWEKVKECLGRIFSDDFKKRKLFMQGLAYSASAEFSAAGDRFSMLLRETGPYTFEASNNLGVAYFHLGNNAGADQYFSYALELKKENGVYLNLILFLMETENFNRASRLLKDALYRYPQDEELILLFSWFLSRKRENRDLLATFQAYIPHLAIPSRIPQFSLDIKNPFKPSYVIKPFDPAAASAVSRALSSGKLGGISFEQLEDLLEANPFVPAYYELMALKHEKAQHPREAEANRKTAKFLKVK
ncbi:MAG: hypothetical protein GY765_34485 [bacterium]|nr:hypothetical protein [bacterium]